MPRLDVVVRSKISKHPRVRQLEGMFDVPRQESQELSWSGNIPLEEKPWNVGLIVGPSGSGKTTIARDLFSEEMKRELNWDAPSVIECFDAAKSMKEITNICQAVGFNTIPAWMRPFSVLSNGEKFRADLARRILEGTGTVVVDEFTSVVDRQVAKIGSHAVQKYIRKQKRQFVAVACHYDIEDWLQPDWILEPSTMTFRRRSVRRRPSIDVEIRRVDKKKFWPMFAPFHYMSASLPSSAQCFVLFVDDRPAAMTGVIHFPHPKTRNIKRISRTVTLPDWQGIGLSFHLNNTIGAMFKARGFRLRNYPAHPNFIRSHDRSRDWRLMKKPGVHSPRQSNTSTRTGAHGGRACAVFEYAGKAHPDKAEALRMLA